MFFFSPYVGYIKYMFNTEDLNSEVSGYSDVAKQATFK